MFHDKGLVVFHVRVQLCGSLVFLLKFHICGSREGSVVWFTRGLKRVLHAVTSEGGEEDVLSSYQASPGGHVGRR